MQSFKIDVDTISFQVSSNPLIISPNSISWDRDVLIKEYINKFVLQEVVKNNVNKSLVLSAFFVLTPLTQLTLA